MLFIGKKINNKYELKKYIASGGMGEVWKAFDIKLNRYVAIKFPHNQFINADSRSLSILESEAQTGAKLLGHPNIISVLEFDYYEENGIKNYYIAMELINGIDVFEWINEYKMRLDESIYYRISLLIALDLCRAIEYSHRSDILHRDIKPSNMFLSEFGITKVGDFGLARFVEVATRTHTVKGSMTYAYASPEQWYGKKDTKKVDVYQAGCTVYHLLTGLLPFDVGGLPALMNAHLNQMPTAPNTLCKFMSDELSSKILNTMEKNPKDRSSLWELSDQIAKELIGKYQLVIDVHQESDEILKKIDEITDISISDLKIGKRYAMFEDYTELLSESIQLILMGVYNLDVIKDESVSAKK